MKLIVLESRIVLLCFVNFRVQSELVSAKRKGDSLVRLQFF